MTIHGHWLSRSVSALGGAGAFAGAQMWAFSVHPGAPSGAIDNPGWFLNSDTSVAAIAAAVGVVAALTALAFPDRPWATAWATVLGAGPVMVGVLAWLGFGNIFPIVILIGGGILAMASAAGAHVGHVVRRLCVGPRNDASSTREP